MKLWTTKDAARHWGITIRRVQALCEANKIEGAVLLGRMWLIPMNTPKPIDGRTKQAKREKKDGS